jgi:hypothetical protein
MSKITYCGRCGKDLPNVQRQCFFLCEPCYSSLQQHIPELRFRERHHWIWRDWDTHMQMLFQDRLLPSSIDQAWSELFPERDEPAMDWSDELVQNWIQAGCP